jgi:hypothetical protein
MTTKNLSRRLERLEHRLLPASQEPLILVIQGVDANRKVVSSFELKVHIPSQPPGQRLR